MLQKYDTEIIKQVSTNLNKCKDEIFGEIDKIRNELAILANGYEGESSEVFKSKLNEFNGLFELFAQDGEKFSQVLKGFATSLEEIELALKKKYEEIG